MMSSDLVRSNIECPDEIESRSGVKAANELRTIDEIDATEETAKGRLLDRPDEITEF